MEKITIKRLIFGGLIVIVLVIGVLNIWVIKNEEFWDVSISSCITILVALVVSYYFTQKNQDERNQKEIYLHLMEKMQSLVNADCLSIISEETDINVILMKKRELNNCTTILKKYSSRFHVEEEIKNIEEKVQEYADIVGNHQDDLKYLAKSEKDLKRPLELIDGKLNEAMLKLFD